MRALRFEAPFTVELAAVEAPKIVASTDALIRVAATCVCGSDLWSYRGQAERQPGSAIGHECIGEVIDVGADVERIRVGDFVVVPFLSSCGVCVQCRRGQYHACVVAAEAGVFSVQGAQAEIVRTPFADGSLVVVPGGRPADDVLPCLLTVSDVMATGYHAAVSARVEPGSSVAIVGDGAVGLCGVIAAGLLGAERIIALSRHAARQDLAREFGATDIVPERGEDAVARVCELTSGLGVDAVLECVGTAQSMETAFDIAAAGATVGFVGLPHGSVAPIPRMFRQNIGLAGGVAPSRRYSDMLVARVLDGDIQPGRVFDLELPFDRLPEGYAAMDERRAIKAISFL